MGFRYDFIVKLCTAYAIDSRMEFSVEVLEEVAFGDGPVVVVLVRT